MMSLQINQLSFERNQQSLFQNLTCTLDPGECLEIVGPNGSGKSTLLRLLAGLIEGDENQILYNNVCILRNREGYQANIQYLAHTNGLKLRLTTFENLQLFCALSNKAITQQKLQTIIDKFQLTPLLKKLVMDLSAGQQRRLALARLLLYPVHFWILDEPMTSLDATIQDLFTQLLKEHLENKGSVIIATHQPLKFTNFTVKKIYLGQQEIPC